jgi:predicted deacetylase
MVNSRNLGLVACIATFKAVNERRVNIAKEVLGRLVLHIRVFHGDRTLENADTLRVLIKDGLDIFSSPKGILDNFNQSRKSK